MGHELEVIHNVGVATGWIQLEFFKLFSENIEMNREFFPVGFALSFDAVLKFSECHSFFILVESE